MEYVIAFVALTAMEIVLAIDNIVFIAIAVGRLLKEQQPQPRRWGLLVALVMRILLLLTLSWILKLQALLFHLSSLEIPTEWLAEKIDGVSGKDLIVFASGLFLIWKSVYEIHKNIEDLDDDIVTPDLPRQKEVQQESRFASVLVQIALMDIIFSIDFVITAVEMVKADSIGLGVMIAAIIVAMMAMLIFAGPVSDFVGHHPTPKVLALAILILIGMMLVAEGIGTEIDKGYIYFAMAFALGVELLNLRMRGKREAVTNSEQRVARSGWCVASTKYGLGG